MFGLFRSKPRSWFASEFSEEEQAAIEKAFKPLGSMTAAQLANSQNPSSLGDLAGHLKHEKLRELGYRVLARGEELATPKSDLISRHFFWSAKGQFYYRWRDVDADAMAISEAAFRQQILISKEASRHFKREARKDGVMVAHAGYRQLRIILEKRDDYEEAIALCRRAKAQGWIEDWDKRIAAIEKKAKRSDAAGS